MPLFQEICRNLAFLSEGFLKWHFLSEPSYFLKGTVSRGGYFFKGLNIVISTFCVCADGFQDLSKAFYYPIQLLTFCFLLWNYLQILKMLTETLLKIPFSVIGRCSSSADLQWLKGRCARIYLSQAASGMIFQNHRLLPVSIVIVKIAVLKGFTGRIFKINKKFQRCKLKL